jgi:hypothetical protein
VYVPASVFGATVIVPSGFIVRLPEVGVGAVPGVSVTSAGFTGAPFSVSLTRTEAVVPPVTPSTAAKLSSTASIGAAATVTVMVAVSQFVGFSASQIR